MNILSVYEMKHTSTIRKGKFTPDFMTTYDMETNLKIAYGKVNDKSHMYTFFHFVPQSNSILLLTHANDESSILARGIWTLEFQIYATT